MRRASRAYSARHQHGDFDFAGGDHDDVDALFGQRAEHPLGHAGLGGHAQAHNGDLRHLVVAGVALGAQFGGGGLHRLERGGQVVAHDREGDVGMAVVGDVLHDHVDGDILGGDLGEDGHGGAGPVGHVADGDAGVVADHGRPAHRPARNLRLGHDQRAGVVAETAADVHRHGELLGELDGTVVHHSRARPGSSTSRRS